MIEPTEIVISVFSAKEVIAKKRDKQCLTRREIEAFVAGVSSAEVSHAQVAALAMAIYFNGMQSDECVALTLAMRDSGRCLNWERHGLQGPLLDKHSTGGVGDKVSLMLGPMLAACGAYVPMISGRGLGHTGGTLDKLESFPGYKTRVSVEDFQHAVADVGVAIVGQSDELAPADGVFYAVRDVTATVGSVPLITASILSKKLAAGLDSLVMDVKVGSGATIANESNARYLAESIVSVANNAGCPTQAHLTDMNQVLGHSAGNALEVLEALEYLSGEKREPRLHRVVMALASQLLVVGQLADNLDDAATRLQSALDSGAAAEVFERMVATLGGPHDAMDKNASAFAPAAVVAPVFPSVSGFVAEQDVRAIGELVLNLGAGRLQSHDAVDHRVGISEVAPIASAVDAQIPLAILHASSEDAWKSAAAKLKQAVKVEEMAPDLADVLKAYIPANFKDGVQL